MIRLVGHLKNGGQKDQGMPPESPNNSGFGNIRICPAMTMMMMMMMMIAELLLFSEVSFLHTVANGAALY